MTIFLGIGIAAVSIFTAVIMLFTMYNALIELKFQVERAWANIDVILEQRHEEIPKLITICEQFGKYERGTLEKLIQARQHYLTARKVNNKIEIANEISEQLKSVFAIGEAYPQLMSSAQFVHLQKRISSLEGQIADRKEIVNETVTNYNIRCQQIPYSSFARILGYFPMPLYIINDQKKQDPPLKIALP
jgi:LemA protein